MVLESLHFDLFGMLGIFLCYGDLNLYGRTNTLGAYLITPEMGSHFVMYLAKMQGLIVFE